MTVHEGMVFSCLPLCLFWMLHKVLGSSSHLVIWLIKICLYRQLFIYTNSYVKVFCYTEDTHKHYQIMHKNQLCQNFDMNLKTIWMNACLPLLCILLKVPVRLRCPGPPHSWWLWRWWVSMIVRWWVWKGYGTWKHLCLTHHCLT